MKLSLARALWITLSILALCPPIRGDEPSPEAFEFFEKRIRPVLAEHCYKCHSEQTKRPKGSLRVDSRDALLKGGDNGPALVAGKPDKSRLLEAVEYRNVDLQMPPKGKLPDAVIADLAKWIKMGAPWPKEKPAQAVAGNYEFDLQKRKREHWAWQALKIPPVPAIKDARWPAEPLDRFILAGLEAKALKPASSAEPRTILRRLYFDIIGLPPTPEEVAAFEKSAIVNLQAAIESTVDQLLASPRFGERWGRHWLDLVRYGESRGHEFDYVNPNAYQYRDYVIRAFNADVPYERFVIEHIAGDLLEKPRLHPEKKFNESILGTGFWFLGEQVHSPVDICQDKSDRFDNMLDVLSKTFLGLTVSCARCHDHKFDAISTKDYYALAGFLESSSYRLARFDTMEQERRLAEQLQEIRDRGRTRLQRALAEAWRPQANRLADYLLAARAAIQTGVETATAGDDVFEDFESGSYEGWEITGTAFGKKPQTLASIGAYQGKINAVGKYFVNSHNIRNGEDVARGDAHKGTMTSRPFTISRAYIAMLVGGGAHDGTCVRLIIDGKPARTATGRDNNQMFPVRWDVRNLRGKTARIQIVDNVAGGWGNIGVDHIVFTDRDNNEATPATFSDAFRRRVEQIAVEWKLDAAVLARWVGHLMGPAKDANHPFHLWSKVCHDKDGKIPDVKPEAAPIAKADVIVDYALPGADGWLPDGFAFGLRPVRVGDLVTVSGPSLRFAEQAAVMSDPAFQRLGLSPGSENDPGALGGQSRAGRTMRTPTFEVKSGRVHYFVKGAGRAYAAVEAHVMINGPLHGQLVRSFKTGQEFQWLTHDLTPYQGRRAHMEFTPADGAELAIAIVVQGDQPPLLLRQANPRTSKAATIDKLARDYQTAFAEVIKRLEVSESAAGSLHHARWSNWLLSNAELSAANDKIVKATKDFTDEQAKFVSGAALASRLALAMRDGSGVNERVFIRGTYKAPGESAPRRLLEALVGDKSLEIKYGSGRLELARQIVDPKIDPFLPRVMANRVWHHLFGKGIVASVDNFGVLGERPTHPELLDHLATQFIQDGWSIKKLIRRIATSRTYQMSIREDAQAAKIDPENRLWQHRRLRRLDGEAIRDAMLAISGRLDLRMHGPSVPVHLTEFQDGRGRPASGPLDGDGRRSVYLAVRRNFLSSFLLAFDAPIPFSTVGRRTVSNVPAQALILMNDPFVHQQAENWAKKALAQPGTAKERIASMYRSAFSRVPTADESNACEEFLSARQAGISNVAAWSALAHVLFNAKEFIYLE